eukprot:1159134-Pelagomonas_calceolata.AAC.10
MPCCLPQPRCLAQSSCGVSGQECVDAWTAGKVREGWSADCGCMDCGCAVCGCADYGYADSGCMWMHGMRSNEGRLFD